MIITTLLFTSVCGASVVQNSNESFLTLVRSTSDGYSISRVVRSGKGIKLVELARAKDKVWQPMFVNSSSKGIALFLTKGPCTSYKLDTHEASKNSARKLFSIERKDSFGYQWFGESSLGIFYGGNSGPLKVCGLYLETFESFVQARKTKLSKFEAKASKAAKTVLEMDIPIWVPRDSTGSFNSDSFFTWNQTPVACVSPSGSRIILTMRSGDRIRPVLIDAVNKKIICELGSEYASTISIAGSLIAIMLDEGKPQHRIALYDLETGAFVSMLTGKCIG